MSGGFYGEQPSLTKLADDDLIATTDFRDVYAPLLAETLDTDPARVLGAGRTTMDFFLSPAADANGRAARQR